MRCRARLRHPSRCQSPDSRPLAHPALDSRRATPRQPRQTIAACNRGPNALPATSAGSSARWRRPQSGQRTVDTDARPPPSRSAAAPAPRGARPPTAARSRPSRARDPVALSRRHENLIHRQAAKRPPDLCPARALAIADGPLGSHALPVLAAGGVAGRRPQELPSSGRVPARRSTRSVRLPTLTIRRRPTSTTPPGPAPWIASASRRSTPPNSMWPDQLVTRQNGVR